MKKVVFIANTSWYLFNHRSSLMKAVAEAGHEVIYIAPYDSYSQRLPFEHLDIRISAQGTRLFREIRTFFSLLRILDRLKPDLIVNFTLKPNLYGSICARFNKIPYINNITGLGDVFIKKTRLRSLLIRGFRQVMPQAVMIFFQNPDDLQMFREKGLTGDRNTALLPGSGVDLERFSPRESETGGNFTFLLFGRLLKSKGLEEYVRAAGILKPQLSQVEFNILGFLEVDNPAAVSRKQMKDWETGGAVNYLGCTDRVEEFISAADCVVFPSYYREGIPRVLLEAAAMGKPIITTDSIGCREVVEDGSNGLLCQPGDAEDLADKMSKMIKLDPAARKAMGLKSREKALKEFDENIVLSKYLTLIDRILKKQ